MIRVITCSTVLLFSLLLLHNRVMSDRKSFLTSSKAWQGLDCRISEATTFRITGKADGPGNYHALQLALVNTRINLGPTNADGIDLALKMRSHDASAPCTA